jgi:hypothetical protein
MVEQGGGKAHTDSPGTCFQKEVAKEVGQSKGSTAGLRPPAPTELEGRRLALWGPGFVSLGPPSVVSSWSPEQCSGQFYRGCTWGAG